MFEKPKEWTKELYDKMHQFLKNSRIWCVSGEWLISEDTVTKLIELINYAREEAAIAAQEESPDCDSCDRIDPDNPPEYRDESRD